jgi:hypothetical protein
MGDISIRESVGLIVGVDTLVFLIVLIEVVRGQYEEIVACFLYLLYVRICQIVAPSTNLRPDRASE